MMGTSVLQDLSVEHGALHSLYKPPETSSLIQSAMLCMLDCGGGVGYTKTLGPT